MIIVGGGPVGMALALAHTQTATLLSLPTQTSGRAYALSSKTAAFLRHLNALPQVNPVRHFLLTANDTQMHIKASAIGADMLCCLVTETALLECLQAQMLNVNLCTLPIDYRIVDCQISSPMAHLSLNDGSCYQAALLVAADGARSLMAQAAQVGATTVTFGQQALSMTLHAPLADDCAAQWFAQRDVLALLPLGKGLFSLVWSLPEAQARLLMAKDGEAVAAAVATRTNLPIKAIDTAVHSFPLRATRRAVRAVQRLAFVGDAARVIHPLAGQGLNLGLADAAFLLQCLEKYKDITESLAAYAAAGGRGEWWHLLTASFNGLGWLPPVALAIGRQRTLSKLAVTIANG